MSILTIHKVADKSQGTRIIRFDPETGNKKLVNPETPGDGHEPWPLEGIEIKDPPTETGVSTAIVATGRAEGWLELVGESVEHRSGGPDHNPWAVTHTFVTAEKLVFKTLNGDVVYQVTRNPGKYGTADGSTEVFWDYQLELESGEDM